jgi:uncharacterized SAM-binding protein YcdF (DUF218 family)
VTRGYPVLFVSALLTSFISPLGAALAGGTIALLLASLAWRRAACWLAALSLLWLLVWSLPPISNWITTVVEGPYQPASEQAIGQLPKAQAIVLLGGGIAPGTVRRPQPDLNDAADRVWHAARLFHAGRAPLILVSGGHDPEASRYSEAQAMRMLLIDLGVPPAAILLEEISRNTRQNASESAKILRNQGVDQILLVTSASHMARALAHFEGAGLRATPAPTDHPSIDFSGARRFLPNSGALDQSTRALKEWVGQRVW